MFFIYLSMLFGQKKRFFIEKMPIEFKKNDFPGLEQLVIKKKRFLCIIIMVELKFKTKHTYIVYVKIFTNLRLKLG